RRGVGGSAARCEPRPCRFASEAELVEPRGRVVGYARGEQFGLPRGGGCLEAFEALDDVLHGGAALQLRAGGEVLPAQQEAHVVARGDGVDLALEAVERVAVNAGEQA